MIFLKQYVHFYGEFDNFCNNVQNVVKDIRGYGSGSIEHTYGSGSGRPTVTDPTGSGTLLHSLAFVTLFGT